MQNKKFNKIIVAIVIFSMVAIYGSVPAVNAASLSSAKDTLSSSAPAVLATSTVTFINNIALDNGGTFEVTFDAGFTGLADATCSDSGTPSINSQTVICTYGSGLATTTSNTITVTHTNPASNVYNVTINAKANGTDVSETAGVKVAIVDTVTMSATVAATLTFTVAGTSSDVTINGITTTATTTATTTPFGTIVSGSTFTVGQDLHVTTNADNGYTVTVQQNGEMVNAGGGNINSFNNSANGTGSTTPGAWADPAGILSDDWTYGHMGLTTDDNNADGVLNFAGSAYAGLNGTAPMTIMAHSGVADGSTGDVGSNSVAYSVRISPLQEAGDYSNTLTYICTPSY